MSQGNVDHTNLSYILTAIGGLSTYKFELPYYHLTLPIILIGIIAETVFNNFLDKAINGTLTTPSLEARYQSHIVYSVGL